MSSRFISFEGIDGAGKSTHIAAVAAWFEQRGATVELTREPGGTPLAETLRGLVLSQPMDAMTEVLLMFAGRRDHIVHRIQPALAQGKTVLCDRFTDSSFAYQGGAGASGAAAERPGRLGPAHARRLGRARADAVVRPACRTGRCTPRRARATGWRDRRPHRDPGAGFFERAREAFARRAAANPARIERLDASLSVEAVWQQVLAVLERRYPA